MKRLLALLLPLLFASPLLATNISSCQTLTAAGTYTLTTNLSSAGTCILLNSSSAGIFTIDLAGFSITYGTGNTITTVTDQSVVHGTGHSTDFVSGVSGNVTSPTPRMVAVTCVASAVGCTGTVYSATTDYNKNKTHGFDQRNAINWCQGACTGAVPANGATYFVSYTYSTPVFGINNISTRNDVGVILKSTGSTGYMIEGAGSVGWGVAVANTTDTIYGQHAVSSASNVVFVTHGVSSAAIMHDANGSSSDIKNNIFYSPQQDTYYRDFQTGSAYLEAQYGCSHPCTVHEVAFNYFPSFQQSAINAINDDEWIHDNIMHGTANATNDFAIMNYGDYQKIQWNKIICRGKDGSCRGIHVDGSFSDVGYNYIAVQEPLFNPEYSGCQLGGTNGIRIFDSTGTVKTLPNHKLAGPNVHDNIVQAFAKTQGSICGAAGIVWRSYQTAGVSPAVPVIETRNSFTTKCEDSTCTGYTSPQQGIQDNASACVVVLNYSGINSVGDTYNCEGSFVVTDNEGGTSNLWSNFTLNKNGTSTFTFVEGWVTTAASANNDWEFRDGKYGTGVDPLNQFTIQTTGVGFSYKLTSTYSVAVRNSTNAAVSGATVTLTDALANTYVATTDSNGNASVVVPWFKRAWNTSSVMTLSTYSPYSLSIVKSGCTTLSASGIAITSTLTQNRQLSGC